MRDFVAVCLPLHQAGVELAHAHTLKDDLFRDTAGDTNHGLDRYWVGKTCQENNVSSSHAQHQIDLPTCGDVERLTAQRFQQLPILFRTLAEIVFDQNAFIDDH
jgi:hypothetical protein